MWKKVDTFATVVKKYEVVVLITIFSPLLENVASRASIVARDNTSLQLYKIVLYYFLPTRFFYDTPIFLFSFAGCVYSSI